MATDVTPTTVIDAATVPQSVIDYLTALTNPDQVKNFFDAFKQYSPAANTALSGVSDMMKKIQLGATGVGSAVKDWGGSELSRVKDGFTEVNSVIQNLIPNIKNMGIQAGLLVGSFTGVIPLSHSFMEVGKSVDAVNTEVANSRQMFGELTASIKALPGGEGFSKLLVPFERLAQMSNPAKQFETGMIAIAASSGTLNELMGQVGDKLQNMDRYAEKFSTQIRKIGDSAGVSSSTVALYAQQLSTIPRAMDTSVEGLDKGVVNMHMLDATMKIATGTGQSFNSVFKDLTDVYLKFGTTGQKALEYVSRLSDVSQELQLPLSLVKNFTQQASNELKFFGDNTQAAMNVLVQFGGALKNTGLGAEAIKELSSTFVSSVDHMNLAQEAYLSKASGGVGGLQGAAQIELLKAQGKFDEVAQKVEQTLRKQFGGKITTLEEAAQSQGAAAQYTKQVQLLTQGPTKIAGTTGEARAIIEAMSKGQLLGKNLQGESENAYQKAISRGNEVQQKQYDVMVPIYNEVKRGSDLATISAYSLQRMALGSGTKMNSDYLAQLRQNAQNFAAQTASTAPGQVPVQGKTLKELAADMGLKKDTEMIRGLATNVAGNAQSLFEEYIYGPAREAIQSSAKPLNARGTVNRALAGQEAGISGPVAQPGKQVIEVQTKGICVRCAREIANEEAGRVSKSHIHTYDMNKDNSITTGGINAGL